MSENLLYAKCEPIFFIRDFFFLQIFNQHERIHSSPGNHWVRGSPSFLCGMDQTPHPLILIIARLLLLNISKYLAISLKKPRLCTLPKYNVLINMIGYNKDDLSLYIFTIKTFQTHTKKDMKAKQHSLLSN